MLKECQKSMTLMEVIMVVVILGILSSIGIVNYRRSIVRAREREAQSMLLLMKHSEDVFRMESANYTTCANTTDCNTVLHLSLPAPAVPSWTYTVPNAGNNTFCAQATAGAGAPAEVTAAFSIRQNQDNAQAAVCP